MGTRPPKRGNSDRTDAAAGGGRERGAEEGREPNAATERGGESHSAIRAGGGLGLGWERESADVFAGLFNPAKAGATERGGVPIPQTGREVVNVRVGRSRRV